MQSLNQGLIDEITSYLKGARLRKFQESVAVINESLALGSWIKRGRVKALSGFYQGIGHRLNHHVSGSRHNLYMCLQYGRGFDGDPSAEDFAVVAPKVPSDVALTWVCLCNERAEAFKQLDEARPVPVITAIGLSPKVTATLTECNLDLDLSTIRTPPIDFRWVQARDKRGELAFDKRTGEPIMEKEYFPVWPKGTKHNASRYARGCHCHACGKLIPSGWFVPMLADCRRNGPVSMWLGLDCARNIFGIKDVGVRQAQEDT